MAWKGPLLYSLLLTAFTLCVQSQECVEYFEESDSMFKKPEVSQRKFENSHIANLTLIERRSYYRCEPAEEKYGIGLEGKEWWVFHGCGGIFEVTECSSNGQPLKMRPESDLAMTQQKADKKAETQISKDGKNMQVKLSGF